jgi:hypothetical protein
VETIRTSTPVEAFTNGQLLKPQPDASEISVEVSIKASFWYGEGESDL